jgi:hypothetical protein
MKLIYYAHPIETYETYLEELMEETVKNYFGETLHIRNYSLLHHILNNDGQKKLRNLFDKMENLTKQREVRKIDEKDAKDIAHEFMRIFKKHTNLNIENVLLNPSIFSDLFIIDLDNFTYENIGKRFKKMSFPHFCYGLIDYCDVVVTHGYVINRYTKRRLKSLLEKVKESSFQPEEFEYCDKLLQIVRSAKWNLWSPGTFNEIKYALDIGKEVYCLTNKTLKKVSSIDDLPDKKAKIPFDDYGLFLYSKIWQPIAKDVMEYYSAVMRIKFTNS